MRQVIYFFTLFAIVFFSHFYSLQAAMKDTEVQAIIDSHFTPTPSIPYRFTPQVDVITGSYVEQSTDLVVAGIEPLSFRRFYHSQSAHDPRFGNWNYNPETFAVANFELGGMDSFVTCAERDGTVRIYQNKEWQTTPSHLHGTFAFDLGKHGNTVSSSGHSHPLNTKIYFHHKLERSFSYEGEIKDGQGGVRFFITPHFCWTDKTSVKVECITRVGNRVRIMEGKRDLFANYWTPYQLPITEEKLPNGNLLCYTYSQWKDERIFPQFRRLQSITAYNASKTKVLGTLAIDYKSGKIEGSDKREVHVGFGGKPANLTSRTSLFSPPFTYQYQGINLTHVIKPEGRLLKTEYDSANRVTAQLAPVGPKGELCPVARYLYHYRSTEFYDAENNKTIYRFDDTKRITAIETYEQHSPYRVERFQWDSTTGNLLSKTLEDAQGTLYFKHTFVYDKNHNPIQETIGDGIQHYTLYRAFSDDGFNLKEKEWDDTGICICYTYVPRTNLLTSEITYDNNQIRKRIFHAYDDCAARIKTILDDGTSEDSSDLRGVTLRKILDITPKQTLPCLGLPEKIQEKTLDSQGRETLLRTITYTYEPSGQISYEAHYDPHGTLCYSMTYTYTPEELLSSTIDPLGHTTTYTYDLNFNRTVQCGPRPDMRQEWTYDQANRPIQEKEWQTDGTFLVRHKKYDKLGRLIAATDPSGFETRYTYDSLGRILATHHPDGSIEKKAYDVLGNPILEVDPNGFKTEKTYNFRGQPLSIHYPDGSHEYFTYFPNGDLHIHLDKNGAKTIYAYDNFHHPTQIDIYSSDGKKLKTSTAVYTAFHKLSEIDPEGVQTNYTYDCAGRKIQETKAGKITIYAYDSEGRVSQMNSNEVQVHYVYDLKGQLLGIKKTDLSDELLEQEAYAYDSAGNQTYIFRCDGTQKTEYNAQGLPTLKQDPFNHKTYFTYVYAGGLLVIEKDPKGILSFQQYDSRGNEIETYKKNGDEIQKVQKRFDGNRNLLEERHSIYDGKVPINETVYSWTYGPCNRLEILLEAGQKKTQFLYDEKGHLACKIKPDGVKLQYEYDPLGRLATFFSPDFCYRYQYDACDRIVSIQDGPMTTTRAYNPHGSIIEEKLANRLSLRHEFDLHGRRISTLLPDKSLIRFTYHGDKLYSVIRQGQTHIYLDRDIRGYPTDIQLPFQLGTCCIKRDSFSRWKEFTSPFYSEEDTYDPRGDLLHFHFHDSLGTEDNTYIYDDLSQLTSENTHHYRYDSLYNRLQKDELAHQTNPLCQLIYDGNTSYEYDPNGNLTYDGTRRYTYDSLDRLTSVKYGITTTTYTYDPFNRRMSKTHFENGKKRKSHDFLYDGENEIGSTEKQPSLQELRILGEGLGAEIGAAVFIELGGKTYIPLHDHRGNLITLIDPLTKKAMGTYRYTAFGEEKVTGILSPWRFASKRIDPETGWVFFGRRYYMPSLGRWTTIDPNGFDDGPNLYAYLRNCPMDDFDPYGLWSWRQAHQTWDYLESGVQTAFPLTYGFAQNRNYLMGIPAAIFEVGMWTTGALEKGAFSLVDKGFKQIARSALARQEGRAALQATKVIKFEEKIFKTHTPIAQKVGNATIPQQGLKGVVFDLDALSKAGQVMDRGGLTKAGRALDKHGNRAGSVFPKASGNPLNRNIQGQFHLDDILTHPQSYSKPNRFGGIDYYKPDGSGARFYTDGTFRGFLEPDL